MNTNLQNKIFEVALALQKIGFDVLSVEPISKYPRGVTEWQKKKFSEDELKNYILGQNWGIGVRDHESLDFDNHGSPSAREMVSEWKALVDAVYPTLFSQLLIEKTPHGGYHISWSCAFKEGNQKLALRKATDKELADNSKSETVCLVESRGLGGLLVISPTPGYELRQNDWFHLSVISKEQRDFLFQAARMLSKISPEKSVNRNESNNQPVAIGSERPGDFFNREHSDEGLKILQEANWQIVFTRSETSYLRRPGKDRGISATWNHFPNTFICFSTSTSFEPQKGYSAYQLLALLKFNGDFSEASRHIVRQYGLKSKSAPNSLQFQTTTPTIRKPRTMIEVVADAIETRSLEQTAAKTNYPELDKMMGGWKAKQLTIITGNTNAGKSALCCNFAIEVAKQSRRILYFSLEPEDSVAEYLASCLFDLKYSEITPEHLGKLSEHNIDFYYRQDVPTEEVLIETLKQVGETYDLIVIDHLGYFLKSGNDFLVSQGSYVKKLVAATRELKTHILGVAHPRKPEKGKTNRPLTMYEIAGSASFYQDASNVLVLDRQFEEGGSPALVGHLLLQKVKKGISGSIDLYFRKYSAKIVTAEKHRQDSSMPLPKQQHSESSLIKKVEENTFSTSRDTVY